MIRSLVTAGRQTEFVNLDLVSLAEAEAWETTSNLETAVVVLGGRVSVTVDEADLGSAGGRKAVFEDAGHAVYVPPDSAISLVAECGVTELAVISASPGATPAGTPRVIGPEDQRLAEVGEGNWSRIVRTILGPEHAASRLLLGETINPPGNWSSYPPHKHDVQAPPEEVRLEEVYYFKLNPPAGFGVQVNYFDDGREESALVHTDDIAVISSGYHPVVAAPGYSLYYLWIMAGDGRDMVPHFDTRHDWVQGGR